ncbi:hypothetical protein PSTG_01429 [Puccinia striiformis f. sp. tritici PST-78]|uniref:Uncharacterized protein n=1 Tax=Puccinia striiformis f. sp. tritici PST-78 TaxID=1165861 RepID=A0A0L0W2X3_9BASI|nr:hypothetical protein PSTG_01429 [Puccinia striiformis f. sp. tritici PST-78]
MDMDCNNVDASDLPTRPSTRPPPSVFFAHLQTILSDPARRAQPGYIALDDASLNLIFELMAEGISTSQRKELTATGSELKESRTSMGSCLAALEKASSDRPTLQRSIHAPGKPGLTSKNQGQSYASKVASNTPTAPKVTPPLRHLLGAFKLNKAIIHVAPEGAGMEKINQDFPINKADHAVREMNATVQEEPVVIKAVNVLKSGDVCFYAKNRARQSWLMEHKHLRSKKVHPVLESTLTIT